MFSKLLIVFLFFTVQVCRGDVDSRIDDLEVQVQQLKEDVEELTKIVEDKGLETTVKLNIADQKLDKAIANVLLNMQEKATMYWHEMLSFLQPSLIQNHLQKLVESTYLGLADNFYRVLTFLTRNELYSGYAMLLKELDMHKELQSGQEVFALGVIIRSTCGSRHPLYAKLPKVVKDVLGGPVLLHNTDNEGYVTAIQNLTQCQNYDQCYRNANSQVYITKHPSTTTLEDMRQNASNHWQFIGPTNITELYKGFYIKNNDLYFWFRHSPASGYLRTNTSVLPYFSREIQVQFLPALIPNTDPEESNLIRIGIRGRMFRDIEYFFSREFQKKSIRNGVTRMGIFQGDMKGFTWAVTPVNGHMDNSIDVGDTNEKCQFSV